MRIYTKVIWCWSEKEQRYTEQYSDSYEYKGKTARCDFGGDSPPPMPEEQKDYYDKLNMLTQSQMDISYQTLPLLAESYGYTMDITGGGYETQTVKTGKKIAVQRPGTKYYEEDAYDYIDEEIEKEVYTAPKITNIRKMTYEEQYAGWSPLQQKEYDIGLLGAERAEKALKGELEPNKALSESIASEEAALTELLRRKHGEGYTLTQDWRDWVSKKEGILDAARHGEITTGANLLYSGQQGLLGSQQVEQTGLLNIGAGFQPAQQGIGMGLQAWGQERAYQLDWERTQAEREAGLWGGLGQLAGAGLSGYGTYAGLKALRYVKV